MSYPKLRANIVYDQIGEIVVEIEIETKERNYGRVCYPNLHHMYRSNH